MTRRGHGKTRADGAAAGGRGWSVSRRIAAPAAVVWRLLIDTRMWPRWGPSITLAELADEGPEGSHPLLRAGSRGRVRTVLGISLPFTVTSFDDGPSSEGSSAGDSLEGGSLPGSRSWSWAVAGLAATGHAVVAVPGGCRVTFTVPWWAPAYLPVCAVALRRIGQLAAKDGCDALDWQP